MKGGKRFAWAPLTDGDVELVDELREVPPPHAPSNKGESKYPFAQVKVGGGMRIRRRLSTVRSAARSWAKRHKGWKFSVWQAKDGWVIVKRIK